MWVYLILFLLFSFVIFLLVRTALILYTLFSDVPFLPSENFLSKKALSILDIHEGDTVLDIGSGDGRVMILASKQYPNSTLYGIERNLLLVIWSNICKMGRKNIYFQHIDALKTDYLKYNKIYIYLLPQFTDLVMNKLEKEVPLGCTVVSLRYPLGYKFSSSHKIFKYPVKYKKKIVNIYKWIKY